ncbi:V-type ATP synthase subunit I [Spirochaetia bacterium]|nr:V-type ATP synthase subunit I [Spirochaetia bacterium]
MIVPMKKVSLVVMDKHREEALIKLRELEVLHLERHNTSSDALTKLLERKTKAENALGILNSFTVKKDKSSAAKDAASKKEVTKSSASKDFFSSDSVNEAEEPDLITRVISLSDERKSLQEQAGFNAKEKSRIEKWGNFNPASLVELVEKGIKLIPYELSLKSYEAVGDDVQLIVLKRTKTVVYAAALSEIPGETPFALPEQSLSELNQLTADAMDKIADIEKQLTSLSPQKDQITAELAEIAEKTEFEAARADMEALEDVPAETNVAWITGFAPKDEVGVLKRACAENGWALMAEEPGLEDNVPTKLKNNKFFSLIYPLTDFLEVTPGYNEVDISPFFLIFFCVFFGMIFGDAGYGALVLFAGIIGLLKTAKKGSPAILKLLTLLGLSNFVWGVLTCTWFGVDSTMLPAFFRQISLPLISTAQAGAAAANGLINASELAFKEGIVQQNLMIFCFSLALLQLSIGHIIAIIKTRSLKILGDVGSIAMLIGMYFIILSLIASNEYNKIPMSMPMVYLFFGGFVLNFIFANYEGNLGRSVLESVKNIISVILGIANVFSDIMSYIRLWAVGLAGGAIAATVNEMAGPMLGHLAFFIFGIVLVVFGHGLNLVLNVLSVLVHGVRLNTLEFSGHAGLTWAGFAYKPFAKRVNRNK